eukprot:TRINITY_DN15083_c3_g1_i2.p1 TRINITY_DN15083_c3_g1~~TRINITY_DN15083_c3_g1_i2.p1  ORF type:complete len:647 (+),score=86.09 TRINITY_DN15083_c3_g1_i2:49-1989(+)
MAGVTGLMRACHAGKLSEVQQLLEENCSLEAVDSSRWTALTYAAFNGNEDIVRTLLQARANPSPPGTLPLNRAAYKGHVGIMRLLIECKAGVNEPSRGLKSRSHDESGPAILAAVYACRPAAVNFLLQLSAEPNHWSKTGFSLLMFAAHAGNEAIVGILLDARADPCAKYTPSPHCDQYTMPLDRTALMLAARNDRPTMLKMLLDAGASRTVNAQDREGTTALMLACWRGSSSNVAVLLTARADIEQKDQAGQTAVMFAIRMGQKSLVGLLDPSYSHSEERSSVKRSKRVSTMKHNDLKVDDSSVAADDSSVETRASHLEAVPHDGVSAALPLQPWELNKLKEVAQQTMLAIDSGRYVAQYGEILLDTLRGWPGSDHWVQKEVSALERLVACDDAASRLEIRRQINDSLVWTLRELEKLVNNMQLNGVEPGAPLQYDPPAKVVEEERVLKLALEESANASEQAECYKSQVAFASSVKQTGWHANSSDVAVKTAAAHACQDSNGSSVACSHTCCVSNRCCHCVNRKIPTGVFPGLLAWWKSRGSVFEETSPRQLRFFCTTCSGRISASQRRPLPFGGCLVLLEGDSLSSPLSQLVQPCLRSRGEDELSLASSLHSWAVVSDCESDGCWEVLDDANCECLDEVLENST